MGIHSPETITWSVTAAPEADRDAIRAGLAALNAAAAPAYFAAEPSAVNSALELAPGGSPAEAQTCDVLVHSEGALIGGLLGSLYWGCGHITGLWVAEDWRGQGLGRALLTRFEYQARVAGCTWLRTTAYSFQRPEYFQAAGWQTICCLPDLPPGHALHTLRKDISAQPAQPPLH